MFRNFEDVQAYVDRHGKAKLVEQLSQNTFSERVEDLVLDWMEADGARGMDEESQDHGWDETEVAELTPPPRPRGSQLTRWVAGFLGLTAVATAVLLVAAPTTPSVAHEAPPVLKSSTSLTTGTAGVRL